MSKYVPTGVERIHKAQIMVNQTSPLTIPYAEEYKQSYYNLACPSLRYLARPLRPDSTSQITDYFACKEGKIYYLVSMRKQEKNERREARSGMRESA